ncbi:pentapeptide repeat-containing protein [Haemophilus haemolyticus]|uniref:pentapeptide repeat-containing protein n=1 Tax=Haemophilus haemolyticus TaxID=726 RepID=UPI000E57E1F6|nr:pentapeptide repeat-containing protein [Haemophilus haemolyticus]
MYIAIKDEKLNEILEQHEIWIKNNKEQGKQATFSGYTLANKTISNKDLSEANFYGAALVNTTFEHTKLENTNFKDTKAIGTNFSDCNLTNANFSLSDLTNANFNKSNIQSAKFINAYLENTNFENCDNKDTADFRNTIKESKTFLSAQIGQAKESLSGALQNTDKRIIENIKESNRLRCAAKVIFGFDILFLIFIPFIVWNPCDITCIHYLQMKFISITLFFGNWSIVAYTLPSITMLIIATTLLRHDQKIINEIHYFSEMKHEIELFSGLLEASQHAANSFKSPEAAAKYVEETFTLIRNKLLNMERNSNCKAHYVKEDDCNRNTDLIIKNLEIINKLIKN